MADILISANKIVQLPEVKELIKKLHLYGLAVCVPHLHTESGEILPLPPGTVQFEKDLVVSFVPENSPVLKASIPTSWNWDEKRNDIRILRNCC